MNKGQTMKEKKAAKAAPKAKKAAPVELPPQPSREYGAPGYTIRTKSKAEAARLMKSFEFRLQAQGPEGFELYADSSAYKAYEGSK